MTTPLAVAQAFFSAIEAGDLAAVEALYAPDAVIWHNTDQRAQSAGENLEILRWMVRKIPSRRYAVSMRTEIPGGFLQQHVLTLETQNGRHVMPACIVAQVRDGRIARLDEYLDSAQVFDMRAALGV
jgi:ketosteroid isomerase-like protein